MVGTSLHGDLEFRPLTVARIDGDRIRILLDTNEAWAKAISPDDPVQVTLSDNRKNHWAWIKGTIALSTDQALIDELWSPFAAAYFDDGRDTPGIAVLTVTVDDGRYWTTASGRIGSLISAIRAKLGRPDQAGEHGVIDPDPST